jgi:hypothetical protein
MGKFAASCMNISQFLYSRQTKTDGTLPVPGDSVKRIESTLIAEPHYTGKSEYCFHLHFVQGANSKYEQNMRTGDIIEEISTVLVLNVLPGFMCRDMNTDNASLNLPAK